MNVICLKKNIKVAIMNIIRKYKLHLLNFDCLTEKEFSELNIIFKYINYCCIENYEVIEFIYNNFLNLKQVELKKYKDYKFYGKDDKLIFAQDLNNSEILIDPDLWIIFRKYFSYNIFLLRYMTNLLANILTELYNLKKYLINENTLKSFIKIEYGYKLLKPPFAKSKESINDTLDKVY